MIAPEAVGASRQQQQQYDGYNKEISAAAIEEARMSAEAKTASLWSSIYARGLSEKLLRRSLGGEALREGNPGVVQVRAKRATLWHVQTTNTGSQQAVR